MPKVLKPTWKTAVDDASGLAVQYAETKVSSTSGFGNPKANHWAIHPPAGHLFFRSATGVRSDTCQSSAGYFGFTPERIYLRLYSNAGRLQTRSTFWAVAAADLNKVKSMAEGQYKVDGVKKKKFPRIEP